MARTEEEDKDSVFESIQANIANNLALMKNSITETNFNETLKHAVSIIEELRNPSLTIQYYYIVCILSYAS